MRRDASTALRRLGLTSSLLAILVTWACEGENLFAPGNGIDSTTDFQVPTVTITTPERAPMPGYRTTDSVLVQVSIGDDQGVDTVTFSLVAFRGDPDLGTATIVPRFEPKAVVLPTGVKDTTITRFLAPLPDTVHETAYIIVAASDLAGNVGLDTVVVALGGPLLDTDLADTVVVEEGKTFPLQVTAQDPRGVKSIEIGTSGAFATTLKKTFSGTDTAVTLDTLIVVPSGASGDLVVTMTSENQLGVREEMVRTATLTVTDGTPPVVTIETPVPDSLSGAALGDSVLVRVRVTDNFGVDSLEFEGFSVRGDPALGTAQVVERFTARGIALENVRDTTVARFMAPVPSTVKEVAFIVVRATDGSGKSSADTARVALGGPDVRVTTELPESDTLDVGAGDQVALTVTAGDLTGVASVRLDVAGLTIDPIIRTFDPAEPSVSFDTVLAVPADFTGKISVVPTATNAVAVAEQGPPVALSVVDRTPPTLAILQPRAGSLAATPLGEPLDVEVAVADNIGVDTVTLSIVAHRGDRNLGTDSVVQRFTAKTVVLGGAVPDTTIRRILDPIADTIKEQSYLIARVVDGTGNVFLDSTSVFIGGPDVSLQNVEDGQSVQQGLHMSVRMKARDPIGLIQLRLDITGVFDTSIVKNFNPAVDTVTLDTTVAIPADAEGLIELTATARNSLDVSGQDGPITMLVITGGAGDTLPPVLQHVSISDERMELQDTVFVQVTGTDNSQGSGVAEAGFTVLGISPSRGDTLIRSGKETFSPPRTGTVSSDFFFQAFNVDSLSLPDTLVFEVTTYMKDKDGNCSASTGSDTLQTFPCDSLATGEIVARSLPGERFNRTIVAGTTVKLPTGGLILDAVVDTLRRNLLLSNFDRNRVEVFRLQEARFLTPIAVGSQPWGMTLNTCVARNPTAGCGDTLLVANSGGTNISNVYLGPASGLGPASEDAARRFLLPDVVLFDIEVAIDDQGNRRYNVNVIPDPDKLSFSDRPQYLARDSTGRMLFSTRVVESLEQVGTIRKAWIPAGLDPALARPEVKMFIRHAALLAAPDFRAAAYVDRVYVATGTGDDLIQFVDHTPGLPTDTLKNAFTDSIDAARDEVAGLGSDIFLRTGRFSVKNIGFHDTTYVAASGDGGWVVFGEGAASPFGRVIMYDAANDRISSVIERFDIITNEGETVRGVGLNYDGTLGVARGDDGYFFSTDLRIQGQAPIASAGVAGGAGAVLHPLHANYPSLTNFTGGSWRPDTHLSFFGTGDRTIDIYDTFKFLRTGRIFIKDIVNGPLKASLPFPEDQIAPDGTPFQCVSRDVTDQAGMVIGQAVEIYENGNFDTPWPADGSGGGTEDRCVVLKLYGTTTAGGVVVVNVRKSDVLRDHPERN